MSRVKSEYYLHRPPEKFRCAQSLLKGFESVYPVDAQTMEEYIAYSGGRVEGGYCGAVYAANAILASRGLPPINAEFIRQTGSDKCLELKKECKVPCQECVRIADRLVAERLGIE